MLMDSVPSGFRFFLLRQSLCQWNASIPNFLQIRHWRGFVESRCGLCWGLEADAAIAPNLESFLEPVAGPDGVRQDCLLNVDSSSKATKSQSQGFWIDCDTK